MHTFCLENMVWMNRPDVFSVANDQLMIRTKPGTDLWKRTHYGFERDNVHALLLESGKEDWSFSFKASFHGSALYDQCGVLLYQDTDNWMKGAIEYHDDASCWLGSVVTLGGYSDWATTEIPAGRNEMWYRLSRKGADYLLESAPDGIHYAQMRIFHMGAAARFGLYACSPSPDGSFAATFTDMRIVPSIWR